MLFNYLKLSLRLLVRNPFYTFINALGLSVGFASFFVLWQHASTELKADQFHKDFERIVRLGLYWQWSDDGSTWGMNKFGATRFFHSAMLKNDFQQVETYTTLFQQPEFSENLVGHGDQIVMSVHRNGGNRDLFEETRVVYADPNLFEFFGLPLIYGSERNLLDEPGSVALSQHIAQKYFGSVNPLGQLLTVNDTTLLTITGVFKDLPHNTHLAFDIVISNVGVAQRLRDGYYPIAASYIKLSHASEIDDFEKAINRNKEKYFPRELKRTNFKVDMFVEPLKDLAFSPQLDYVYHFTPKSRPLLIFLQGIAIVIFLMAWVNYMNLAVSRMMKRMKEVATRKMSGALSFDFIKQFLIESSIIHVLAVTLAFSIMQLVRVPAWLFFQIYVADFSAITSGTWLVFGGIAVLGILITGLYPVLMSISYNPRSLSSFRTGRQKAWLQAFLTISQYTSALVLILWAFIVYLQLDYILHKDLGIQTEQVVIVDSPVIADSRYVTNYEHWMNEVRAAKGVRDATYSFKLIGDSKYALLWVKRPAQSDFVGMGTLGGVDEHFIPFYGIPLLAGRNFVSTDKDDVIILSRYSAQRLGYENPSEATGENVMVNKNGSAQALRIIGVIENFRDRSYVDLDHVNTENTTGQGACLIYKNNLLSWFTPERMSVRIDPNRQQETLDGIKKGFDQIFPGNIFKWYFLNDHINKAYLAEKISRNQIMLFTALAIGISCLGLLGMMTVRVEEKTKEIGIRKVLGAGMNDIGKELLKNVAWHAVIAMTIALPASYYLATQYLGRYIESISLQWWQFTLPMMSLVIIMFVTIASVLWRAAKSNPVEALKYE